MPLRHPQVTVTVASLVFALLGLVPTVRAVPTNAPAPAKVGGGLVQPPFIAPAIPQSTFVIPTKRAEGRDPFFPRSDRVYGEKVSTNKVAVVTPVAELTLKGISGTPEKPLAIINNITFTSGEENDVLTQAGRIRIRCIEINMDAGTVLVQVGGARRELRLAPLK
jgi:hypothetical protein